MQSRTRPHSGMSLSVRILVRIRMEILRIRVHVQITAEQAWLRPTAKALPICLNNQITGSDLIISRFTVIFSLGRQLLTGSERCANVFRCS